MLNVNHLQEYIIDPTLEHLGLYSLAASELMLGTAIQESRLTYLTQLDGDDDPYDDAIGLWQVERKTHDDIWDNWLRYRGDLVTRVTQISVRQTADEMLWNLYYACAMARIHYRRVKEALPPAGDREGQAVYWKTHYNTHLGAGGVQEYVENWERYVKPQLRKAV